jgi:hypothetical protein
MTRLHQNVEEMLVRLTDDSKGELDLIRALGDAIRRVDDQLLREVRSVTLQHEIRREAILGELQTLATRLCALPMRNGVRASSIPTIDQQAHVQEQEAIEAAQSASGGADWRQATQNIGDDFEFAFDRPRH